MIGSTQGVFSEVCRLDVAHRHFTHVERLEQVRAEGIRNYCAAREVPDLLKAGLLVQGKGFQGSFIPLGHPAFAFQNSTMILGNILNA